MSNVIRFRPRAPNIGPGAAAPARDAAALLSDLAIIAEQVRAAGAGASGLPIPRIEVEQVVQSLLDALTALERAEETLAPHDERLSF